MSFAFSFAKVVVTFSKLPTSSSSDFCSFLSSAMGVLQYYVDCFILEVFDIKFFKMSSL